jgi:hypothetical protein
MIHIDSLSLSLSLSEAYRLTTYYKSTFYNMNLIVFTTKYLAA